MDAPVIPIQRKSMYRDHINCIQHPIAAQELDEVWIDGRNSSQNNLQIRINLPDRPRARQRHMRKHLPVRINLEIPMREIIRLVLYHYRLDHSFPLAVAIYRVPSNSIS